MTTHLMTEKEFMAQIIQLLELYDWRYYHTFDSRRSAQGFPDLVAIRPPRFILAELKTDNGKLTAAQREWLEALGRVPHVETFCWRPGDFEEIVALLRR